MFKYIHRTLPLNVIGEIEVLKEKATASEMLEEALLEIAQNQSDLEDAVVELAELLTEV